MSAERAYKRYYPAIDPLVSWSRYREQLAAWYQTHLGEHWIDRVDQLAQLLKDGENIYRMMQVTGEEGISLQDYVTYQKALFVDMVYLQQDAFDAVDVSTPLARQQECFELIVTIVNNERHFENKHGVRVHFTRLTKLFRNLNYSRQGSDAYQGYWRDIEAMYQ